MMNNTCIAAFRTPARRHTRGRHGALPKSGAPSAPGLTALAECEIHRCVQRQADKAAIPAYYTLCGYLVPVSNVEQTDVRVTCPKCLGLASEATS